VVVRVTWYTLKKAISKIVTKNGLSAGGRALQKHGSRLGSKFPKAKGNPQTINKKAEEIIENIVKNGQDQTRHHARFGKIKEYKLPSGKGARFSEDGKTFIGLIE